jgi:hypothetical protein
VTWVGLVIQKFGFLLQRPRVSLMAVLMGFMVEEIVIVRLFYQTFTVHNVVFPHVNLEQFYKIVLCLIADK